MEKKLVNLEEYKKNKAKLKKLKSEQTDYYTDYDLEEILKELTLEELEKIKEELE